MVIIPKYQNMLPVILSDPNQQTFSSKRHYSAIYKHLYVPRLKMALKLIGNKKYNKILDAGFGSGIFLPELAKRCENLVEIDIHKNIPIVKEMSEKEKIEARFVRGDLVRLPFQNSTFDCVVSLSVLEFIEDVEGVLVEIRRISKRGAKIVIGAPILNHFTGYLYNLVGFKKHKTVHKSDQNRIIHAAQKFFTIKKIVTFPVFLPLNISLFFVAELTDK